MKLTTIIYNWKRHYTVASPMTTDAADWQIESYHQQLSINTHQDAIVRVFNAK